MDPIVATLRQRRLSLNLSQADVARRLDVTANSISKLEANKCSPTLHTLRQWAGALGFDLFMAAQLQPRQHRPCGTIAAARRHHARGEQLDPHCRAAQRKYDREHKAARRARKWHTVDVEVVA